MLHVVTVKRRGALVCCTFELDNVEIVMLHNEAKQIGDALVRASFANGKEVQEVWAVENEELEVVDDRNGRDG